MRRKMAMIRKIPIINRDYKGSIGIKEIAKEDADYDG
jgi:hypothetical protein